MFRPLTSPAVVLTGGFVTVLIAISLAVFVLRDSEPSHEPSRGYAAPAGLGHVHGLGVDPSDEALYIASHFGVFRIPKGDPPGAQPSHVADRWQDAMGFAVDGPGRFLASGHPALDEDLLANLGLIEFTDGAKTWQPVSLLGEADFHALEPAGAGVYGYSSTTGALMFSEDRVNWSALDRRPLVDLAVNPAQPHVVYATTPDGQLLRYDTSQVPTALVPVPGAPALTQMDFQTGGPLVGAGTDGRIYTKQLPSPKVAATGSRPARFPERSSPSTQLRAAGTSPTTRKCSRPATTGRPGRRWPMSAPDPKFAQPCSTPLRTRHLSRSGPNVSTRVARPCTRPL